MSSQELAVAKEQLEIIKKNLSKDLPPDMLDELIKRIEIIANTHEQVPRIKKRDFITAGLINLVITILYFVIILT